MKNEKRIHVIAVIACILPLIAAAILFKRFPDEMVIHWDAQGNPNGYANKITALFVLPGLLFLLAILMPKLMKIDPKYENMDPKLRAVCVLIVPIVDILCCTVTMGSALGYTFSFERCVPILMGLLFILIGNYLPKTRQSYTLGIKLPWTLNSEENWNRTHRLGGIVWCIGGILLIIAGILKLNSAFMTVIFISLVLLPTLYSYLLYRKGI